MRSKASKGSDFPKKDVAGSNMSRRRYRLSIFVYRVLTTADADGLLALSVGSKKSHSLRCKAFEFFKRSDRDVAANNTIKPQFRHSAKLLSWLFSMFFLWFLASGASGFAAPPPALFDPQNRPVAAGADAPNQIRFLTADDYPPFEFLGADGALAGFNIDLARAICAELKATCTIQPRRWDNLLDALDAKEGDAIVASLRDT
ncbi:MAG: transporter substrate-binding domain-containing protein, partial [Candidatus Pacebacteria bacterium]|nr:transporter substrate-binding domain-containing protein [Candidatus Paceibacterota bacterium]